MSSAPDLPAGMSGKPAKSATLHDVARVAGVSLITASRALSKPEVVSDKTIARVQQAVQATGYIPNLLAGGLKSQRSRMVAALVPTISMAQFLPTVQALTETLDAAGYQLMLGQSGYDRVREDALLNTMISRRPDGIVVTGLVQSPELRERLRRVGIPVVETWDLSEQPLDMLVGFSHQKVGAAVAAYFVGKGWQHLGIATGDDHRATLRREGFLQGIGRPLPTAVLPAPSNLALGRRALGDLLQQDPQLRAVYCSSDQLAHGVLVEALARGLRVPEDLAICGFGDADFAAHIMPALTTVQVDGAGIGRRAAQLIIERCRGDVVTQRVFDLGFRVIERRSTGGA
ncbi:LacI family DNA-binding transcriptional regulator [Aquabacterium sp.]|uniref:LacI family DNA-binding transcriptional regulator n=1 Tax=Aquabacterium sp. TaxID=1872578 RepID=UPI002BFF618A|nr:LacI family DNA-binding transcriptional regulator [Aquabacterium sp.]HSW09214.1 LacI family DNA-binding transcriptional regulator [Aquabacterium sp.]